MFNIRLQQNAIVNEAYSTKYFNVNSKSKVFRLLNNIKRSLINIIKSKEPNPDTCGTSEEASKGKL